MQLPDELLDEDEDELLDDEEDEVLEEEVVEPKQIIFEVKLLNGL